MAVKEQYLDFILNGGNIDDLHAPGTREEEKLYKLITGFEYQDKINREAVPHVECVLHSDSSDRNFLGTYLDLGDERVKDTDIVKVKFRFALRETGSSKPKSIGVRLFANHTNAINLDEYFVDQYDLVVEPLYGTEYTAEAVFPIAGQNNSKQPKDLKTYRYLLPYLMLMKTEVENQNKVLSHGIDIYEATVSIGDKVISVIDTASDFGPLFDSKIEHIGTAKPKKIVKAVLNSKGIAENFLGAVYDLGVVGVVDGSASKKAKARVTFKLKNTGTEIPKGVSLRLFGSPDNGSIGVAGTYSHMDGTIARVIDNLTYEKEYTLEGEFPAQSSNGQQLSTCRYLKPYLTLSKNIPTEQSATKDASYLKTHGIEVSEISIIINGTVYDITHTAEDMEGQANSKVEIVDVVEKNLSGFDVLYGQAGKVASFIGDSITWGYTPHKGDLRLKNPWTAQLKDLCKFKEVYNYGISGDSVAVAGDKHSMVKRYKNISSNSDVIGVLGGLNDHSFDGQGGKANVQFGAVGTLNENTFCGAYETMVKGLVERFPDKKIFLMTLMPNGQNYTRTDKKTLDDYSNAIKSIGKKYGIPVFDIGAEVGFSCNVAWQKDKYMADAIHPTQAGADLMAEKIANFINTRL